MIDEWLGGACWQDEAKEVSAQAKHDMIAMTSFFYMYEDFVGGEFLHSECLAPQAQVSRDPTVTGAGRALTPS